MKFLIISIIAFVSFIVSPKADYYKVRNNFISLRATVKQSSLPDLISLYYDIKNALVIGDANLAATKAEEFVKSVNSTIDKTITESVRSALLKDAGHISETKDIKEQREAFVGFSSNMYALTKAGKFSRQSVYYDYCPMKKAYWLSSEATIKNPYFGSAMLSCGSIKETLK